MTRILTINLAGLRAMFETDIKKIVALSTLRQLGVIILAVGLSFFKVAFFHLVTHAFFKALLFIGVGNLIHQSNRVQDLRQITLRRPNLPSTFAYISVANLRLCGVPFIAGFFSKDLLLENMGLSSLSLTLVVLVFSATAFTSAYTARFFVLITAVILRSEPLLCFSEKDFQSLKSILLLC